MSTRKAVLVKFPLDEFLAIEAARGTTDRSTWIRARLREALLLSGRALMDPTDPDGELTIPSDSLTRW